MKSLQTSNGFTVLVDDQDYESIMQWSWYYDGHYVTRVDKTGYLPKLVRLHRFILSSFLCGADEVDHRNHNTLDYQRHNLRICSRSQNMANTRKRSGLTSIYKGVRWNKKDKRWEANICKNKQSMYLGQFHTEIEAAQRYDESATKLFGEFACLNFPPEKEISQP